MVIVSHNESMKIPENFYRYHRDGVWCCPHCDWKDDRRQMDKWYDKHHLEELIFGSHWGKLTGFIAVSLCPSCGELSWLHEDYDMAQLYFHNRPDIQKIIDDGAEKRKKYVKAAWASSPCQICKCLIKDETTIEDYLVHVHCKGMGWSSSGPMKEKGEKCERMS